VTSQPAQPQRGRAALRRTEIVVAAAKVFARDGYAHVGLRDIAEVVGIRGPSLYHHFESKEDILYAVCLTVTREPNEQTLPLLDATGTPAHRMAALVRGHVRHLHRRQVEHLVALHELPSLSPEHREEIVSFRRYYQRRVRDTIAAGIREGEFTVPHPQPVTVALLDLLNGFSGWYRESGSLGLDAIVEDYVDLVVLRLLGAPAGVLLP
jgi:AcrR family transcriptional regulator